MNKILHEYITECNICKGQGTNRGVKCKKCNASGAIWLPGPTTKEKEEMVLRARLDRKISISRALGLLDMNEKEFGELEYMVLDSMGKSEKVIEKVLDVVMTVEAVGVIEDEDVEGEVFEVVEIEDQEENENDVVITVEIVEDENESFEEVKPKAKRKKKEKDIIDE